MNYKGLSAIALLVVLCGSFVQQSEAIYCYECNPTYLNCNDPFYGVGIPVTGGCRACVKRKTERYNYVSRICAFSCTPSYINGVRTSCCYNDYCNASTSQFKTSQGHLLTALGLMMASYFFASRA